jgi:putative ABC transport system permease protein
VSGRFLLVRRSLAQHRLSTTVTVLAAALACGLTLSVFSIASQTKDAFTDADVGYDAVLGARGSPLQLILNSVYHLETSAGNIPWSMFQTIRDDPQVDLAIPYGVGDNYQGFRIVGTSEQKWTESEVRSGEKFRVEIGKFFDGRRREAVLGSFVAQRTGLKVNDKINPSHGENYAPGQEHAEVYNICGILEPTNTPADRVIWIPLEGIWRMQGHVLRGAGENYVAQPGVPIPDEHKEISAVLVKLSSNLAGRRLAETINRRGDKYTFAWPIAQTMLDLFNKLFWFVRILEVVAYLVVAVATGAILASIYNTMNERRREFAILRSLGASRATISSAIVLESATIAALGALVGYVVYAGILGGAAAIIRSRTGVVLDPLAMHPILWAGPLGMVILGGIAGLLPASKAYATDVASNLR